MPSNRRDSSYSGFYANHEVNVLIEGHISESVDTDIFALQQTLAEWHRDPFSFEPTEEWLSRYRDLYVTNASKQCHEAISTPPLVDSQTPVASWLRQADWGVYLAKVLVGLKQHARSEEQYHDVLNAAATQIPIPWLPTVFQDIEKRRIIGGMPPYAWLGHVAASGDFRRLLASGSVEEHSKMVAAVNTIAGMNPPMPWPELKKNLDDLVGLGPTMKVWGRVLCLVRPDLFCTVSSESVRRNLSATLEIRKARLDATEGYVQLIKLLHESPWFGSICPSNSIESEIWRRRVAFLDAVFHDEVHP